jgi:hypothetical protein
LPNGWTGVERSVTFCAPLEFWPRDEYFLIKEIDGKKYLKKEGVLSAMVDGLTNNLSSKKFL